MTHAETDMAPFFLLVYDMDHNILVSMPGMPSHDSGRIF